MPTISKSEVSLRISGDDIVPSEITRLLGCEPDRAWAKGDEVTAAKSGRTRTVTFGLWSLYSGIREPANLDDHIFGLIAQLTSDLEIWADLANRFDIDLFSSLFLHDTNEGLVVSAEALRALGDRGIELGLDIYANLEGD